MATIRRGGQIQSKLGFLIYGDKGTWKSSLALELTRMTNEKNEPMKVLYIDTEEGSVDDYLDDLYEEHGVNIDNNIIVAKTKTFDETMDMVKQAKEASVKKPMKLINEDENGKEIIELKNEDGSNWIPDAIVIDSLTVLYNQLVQAMLQLSQKRAGQRANKAGLMASDKALAIDLAGIEVKDYQTIKHKGQELILGLMASGKHFVVIGRETEIKEQKSDSNNQYQTIGTGTYKADGFKDVDYNVKTVLHTVNEDGTVYAIVEGKDRTKVKMQNEKIKNPTLLDWQIVIKNNIGKKEVKVADNLQESVIKDAIALQNKAVEVFEETIAEEQKQERENKVLTPKELQNEIADLISKISNNQKLRTELKKLCETKNIPLQYSKIEDTEILKNLIEVIMEFFKENGIK